MKVTRKDIKAGIGERVHIIFLGDNHEGAKNHAKKEFQQAIKKIINIRRKEKVIIIFMGDYIDCINHKDPRFNPSEIADKYEIKDLANLPNVQMSTFMDDVKPLMDSAVAWLYGNHEESYVRHNGTNPMEKIKSYYEYKLDQDAPILGSNGVVELGINNEPNNDKRDRPHFVFQIWVDHGVGGGGYREGYPINKVHDIFRWVEADIHCIGHLHQMANDVAKIDIVEYGKKTQKTKLFGVTGCFLHKSKQGSRGYYEGKPGKNSLIGFLEAIITVGKNKRDCKLEWKRNIF